MIKSILLDYGGTIDTNGLHWAVVLRNSYEHFGIDIPYDVFKKAYAFGEKSLAINPLVNPTHNFLDVLLIKVQQQFLFLAEHGHAIDNIKAEAIAIHCDQFAKDTIAKAEPSLHQLAEKYPLIMVSNFYGNLNTVLEDFGIRKYFTDVIESAVVGVRKPDPAIYQYGVDRSGFAANECAVVGDSFSKDIVPAKKTGCFAIWLNKKGWEEDAPAGDIAADKEIGSFSELPATIEKLTDNRE